MNSRGQVVIYGGMLVITIIVLALAFAPVIKDFTASAMNTSVGDTIGLDCDGTSSNFVKATCVVADMSNFYFFGTLIFMGGLIILAKIVFD